MLTRGNLLQQIENLLKSQGFKITTVSDLIYKDNYIINNYFMLFTIIINNFTNVNFGTPLL